jgi:predicted metal-dependent hydrolase
MSKTNKAGRTNLKMNDSTYNLRRKVMGYIYEAREILVDMPRVEVRIVENEGRVLGTATLGGVKHISICERTLGKSDDYIRTVVFHELAHTLFDAQHNESCPLMSSTIGSPLKKSECLELLRKYSKS